MAKKTLVCVIGELRAHRLTFDTFRARVLEPCNGDLLVCAPVDKSDRRLNAFIDKARYVRLYDSARDITSQFEEIARESGCRTDWKRLLRVRKFWLGGVRDLRFGPCMYGLKETLCNRLELGRLHVFRAVLDWICGRRGVLDHLSGGAYVLLYRYWLLKMLKAEGLDKTDDRFIVTRSDLYYGATHPPMDLLDEAHVWIPEGEDWRGHCDRHWVLSARHLERCLDLLAPVFGDPSPLFQLMEGRSDWNTESYIKLLWDIRGISVRRFPRVQFLVRHVTGTPSWTQGVYIPELQMTVAYPTEYAEVVKNIPVFSQAGSWMAWARKNG